MIINGHDDARRARAPRARLNSARLGANAANETSDTNERTKSISLARCSSSGDARQPAAGDQAAERRAFPREIQWKRLSIGATVVSAGWRIQLKASAHPLTSSLRASSAFERWLARRLCSHARSRRYGSRCAAEIDEDLRLARAGARTPRLMMEQRDAEETIGARATYEPARLRRLRRTRDASRQSVVRHLRRNSMGRLGGGGRMRSAPTRSFVFSAAAARAPTQTHTHRQTHCAASGSSRVSGRHYVCVCSRSSVCLCVCVCDLLMIQIRKTDRRANERTNGRRMCAVAATLYAALCGRQLCAPERFQPARARLWPLGRLPSRGWPLAKLASQKSKRAQR